MLSRSPLLPTARPVSRPGAPRLVSAFSPEASRTDTDSPSLREAFDVWLANERMTSIAELRRERIALLAGTMVLITLAALGIIAAALALGVL